MTFPAHVFRAYDIRGIVGEDLTDELLMQIGQAFGSEAKLAGENTVIVGRDGRHSGVPFKQALIKGLTSAGVDVIDIGCVPTPLLYFATHHLNSQTGIIITGSHNPVNYNGLKMVLKGQTLAAGHIQLIKERIQNNDFLSGTGTVEEDHVEAAYLERVKSDICLRKNLKVVVDAGNGAAGPIAETLYRELGCEVIPLYCDIDGDFPNHHPDPSKPENIKDLVKTVAETGADLGLAFDGDGDRLGVVDVNGQIIWPDRQMILFAQDVLSRCPGMPIIYDVKCSNLLTKAVKEAGGVPVMSQTGHSLIKARMKKEEAPLAGELSGHIFFKERWFGFDDGVYAGARLLEILSKQAESPTDILNRLPAQVATPEINVTVDEAEKFTLVDALKAAFLEASYVKNHELLGAADVSTVDGIRLDYDDAWGLVRASNTTPCLVIRFEATTDEALVAVKAIFRQIFQQVAPEVTLTF